MRGEELETQICGVQRATVNLWPVDDGAAVADGVDYVDRMRRRCCWPVGWRSVVASSCGEVQKPVSVCVAREGRSGAGGEQLG